MLKTKSDKNLPKNVSGGLLIWGKFFAVFLLLWYGSKTPILGLACRQGRGHFMQREERDTQFSVNTRRKPQSPPVIFSDLILFFILIVSIISLVLRVQEE